MKYGPPKYLYRAVVLDVHDGDTIKLEIDLGYMRREDRDLGLHIFTRDNHLKTHVTVRLNGCNAPELNTSDGKKSRDALQTLLPVGRNVIIKTHLDQTEKYGRLLADIAIQLNGVGYDITTLMIEKGFAKPWDGHGVRPTAWWKEERRG